MESRVTDHDASRCEKEREREGEMLARLSRFFLQIITSVMRESLKFAMLTVAPEINATSSKISQARRLLIISRNAASVHELRFSKHI